MWQVEKRKKKHPVLSLDADEDEDYGVSPPDGVGLCFSITAVKEGEGLKDLAYPMSV